MKIVLEFDGHEETEDAARAFKALPMAIALHDIGNVLRSRYKYSQDEAEIKFAEEIRDAYFEILHNNGIIIEDLLS